MMETLTPLHPNLVPDQCLAPTPPLDTPGLSTPLNRSITKQCNISICSYHSQPPFRPTRGLTAATRRCSLHRFSAYSPLQLLCVSIPGYKDYTWIPRYNSIYSNSCICCFSSVPINGFHSSDGTSRLETLLALLGSSSSAISRTNIIGCAEALGRSRGGLGMDEHAFMPFVL